MQYSKMFELSIFISAVVVRNVVQFADVHNICPKNSELLEIPFFFSAIPLLE